MVGGSQVSRLVTDGTTPFTMVPHWLTTAVSPRAVVVYVALGVFADNRTGKAWPSMAAIAEAAGCHEDVARKAIRELEDVGAVKVERTAGGVKHTNRYVLDAMNRKHPRQNPRESTGRNPRESTRGTRPRELEPVLDLVGELQVGANTTARNEFGRMFDLFWELAVRKAGKGEARKALEKAVKVADVRTVIGPAWRQANEAWATWPDKTKVPYPATWLNQERWDDDPVQPHQAPATKLQRLGQITEALDQFDSPDAALAALLPSSSTNRKELGS